MKALFISNDPPIFDAESPVRLRLRAYAAEIGELHIVSRANASVSSEPIREEGLTLHPIHAGRASYLFGIISIARKLIREQGIEIVSVQDPFEHGLAGLIALIGTPAKLHVQIHTDILSPYFANDSWKNRARLLIAPLVLRMALGIRVVSKRIRDSLIARYGRKIAQPAVIPVALPNGVPEPVLLPANSFMFALIAVSRLEREKCVEDILAALALVRRKYPGVGLFIAGEGRKRAALARRAEALGLSDAVVFLGKRADAWGLMRSAQALVQASAYEGYGLTLLEAALAGTPIVSTDVGIIGGVLAPGEDALVSGVGDVNALAENIMRLIEKGELRESLSLHAKAAAAKEVAEYRDQPVLIAGNLAETLAGRYYV